MGWLRLQRGELRQLRIGFVIPGHQCQRDAISAASFDEPLDPVGPIGGAAEQSGDDQARAGDRRHIEVDRKIVAETWDRSEPKAGCPRILRAAPLLCRGEERDFGIGARQQYNVALALGEIDRGRPVGDRSRCRCEQVHSAAQCSKRRYDGGAIEAFAADHDQPRLALFTGIPGPIEMLLQPVADRLHDLSAIATGQVDKPFHPQDVMQADR